MDVCPGYRYGRYNADGMTTPCSVVTSTNDGDGDGDGDSNSANTAPGDALRISEDDFRATYDQAFTQWSHLHALALKNPGLPSIDLCSAFRHVPRFPRQFALKRTAAGKQSRVYASGFSVWGTSGLRCLHPPPPFELPVQVEVASMHTNTLVTETPRDGLYAPWFGGRPNYVAILALAWSYILSARWAEIMPVPCAVAYSSSESNMDFNHDDDDADVVVVDIGDAGEEEAQWWSAILQQGSGWKAGLDVDGETFSSPWSVHRHGSHHFAVADGPCATPTYTTCTDAASFSDARRFLQTFVGRHDIADQSLAALAAVLLFPTNSNGEPLRLPVSQSLKVRAAASTPPVTPPDSPLSSESPSTPGSAGTSGYSNLLKTSDSSNSFMPLGFETVYKEDDLDRLILLSCYAEGMRSILTSVFYDPSVECNAASASLQGQLAAINTLAKDEPCTLGSMLMARLPQVSILWLGISILGLQDSVLECARFGIMPIDLTSAAWSGTTQTFMQLPMVHRNKPEPGEQVARADECRLLFLAQEHRHTRLPVVQWKPFGYTPLQDVDLEVREHARCHGHQLCYQGFRWEGDGRAQRTVSERARAKFPVWMWPLMRRRVACLLAAHYKNETNGAEEKDIKNMSQRQACGISHAGMDMDKQAVSENSTRNILSWLRVDGWARHERYIWGDGLFSILEKRAARARARAWVVEGTASDVHAADKTSETARWVTKVTTE